MFDKMVNMTSQKYKKASNIKLCIAFASVVIGGAIDYTLGTDSYATVVSLLPAVGFGIAAMIDRSKAKDTRSWGEGIYRPEQRMFGIL